MQHKQIDLKRFIRFIVYTIISLVISFSLPKAAIESTEIASTLITIFSIFAGFMIALMAITSHLHDTENWKEIAVKRENIEARLLRQQFLFYCYLSTLGLIVFAMIIEHYTLWGYAEIVSQYTRRMYIFIGLLSLFLSFSLPYSLRRGHEKKITEQLNKVKQERNSN